MLLKVHRHVSACTSCAEQCDALPALKQDYEDLLAALMPEPGDEPYHLTRTEMGGYVRGGLDAVDTESAESHLSVCAQCAQATQELRDEAMPTRRPSRNVGAGLLAPLRAWRRPALFASLTLIAVGLTLTALFIRRGGDGRPAQSVTNQAESAKLNSNQREIAGSESGTDGGQSGGGTEKGQETAESKAGLPNAGGGEPNAGGEIESNDAVAALLSPSSRRAITSALKEQRLEVSSILAQLREDGGTLRGGSGDGRPFSLLSPVGKVVQSASPTFSWTPLAGATSYVVTVADDGLNEVATSGPLTKTEWSLRTPLGRGGVYSWQVSALKDGRVVTSPVMPAPQAKFIILDQAHSEELKRVRAAAPRYHLGLGVLYARAGLLEEAEREFRALVKTNPRSNIARRLLQSVQSIRR
jgi:hypothetical protein